MDQFDRVYSVEDWYDGPRMGIADFHGHPHLYRSRWNESTDDWDERYVLSPVDANVLALALERWEIWRRFERAYKDGRVAWSGEEETWGALPEELARYHQLGSVFQREMSNQPSQEIRAAGEFRPVQDGTESEVGVLRNFEVRWTPVE